MKSAEKYLRAFLLGLQNAMEYRANFVLLILSTVSPIFIQVFLWIGIFQGSGGTPVFGYTFRQMIAYTVMANIIGRLVRTGFEYEMNDDIKNGGLNKYIVRPIGYFSYRLSCFLGQKAFQSAIMLVILIGVTIYLSIVMGLPIGTGRTALFCLALSLAFVLNYIIFFCVGTTAFWLLEIGFLFEAVRIVFIAMSGGIFPLDVFGPGVRRILDLLPFKYTVQYPVNILTGRLDIGAVWQGIGIQVLWVVAGSLAARWLWRKGTRRYVAVGG
ncbi:MAG: ABC transporter permease [Patescibacteria group bacterium]